MPKLSKLKTGMPLQNSKSLFVFVPTASVENVDIEITVHQVFPTNMVFGCESYYLNFDMFPKQDGDTMLWKVKTRF